MSDQLIDVSTELPLWENSIYAYRAVTSEVSPGDVRTTREAYTVPLNGPTTAGARNAARDVVTTALSDNSLDSMSHPMKQEYLTSLANSTVTDYNALFQGQTLQNATEMNPQVIKYVPTYDYSKDLENSILNPGAFDTLGPVSGQVAKISSAATVGKPKGITVNERNRKLDGDIVDPYKNIANPTGEVMPYDIIGGADLTAFLIMEYPKLTIENLAKDKSIQEKDIMMIEMDNVLSLSYSTIRERFPVRQLGKLNPVAMTGGLRTIAGHIAFVIFTEDILARLRNKVKAAMESVDTQFRNFKGSSVSSSTDFDIRKSEWESKQEAYNNFLADSSANAITLLDSLPPFNLLVMGTNEAGTFTQFMLRGVSIIDENQYQGTQQPNIINKVSYVATDIVPMHTLKNSKRVSVHSANSIDESYSKGVYNGNINFNYEVSGSGLVDSMLTDLALPSDGR